MRPRRAQTRSTVSGGPRGGHSQHARARGSTRGGDLRITRGSSRPRTPRETAPVPFVGHPGRPALAGVARAIPAAATQRRGGTGPAPARGSAAAFPLPIAAGRRVAVEDRRSPGRGRVLTEACVDCPRRGAVGLGHCLSLPRPREVGPQARPGGAPEAAGPGGRRRSARAPGPEAEATECVPARSLRLRRPGTGASGRGRRQRSGLRTEMR